MRLPQQQNPSDRNDTARAPYNFVALPEQTVEALRPPWGDRYHTEKRLTGHIDCTLTTESPLYVRAALNREEYEAQSQRQGKKRGLQDDKTEFFYIDPETKQPVIPGSSLRGMLRTLMEIVAYAKLEFVSDESLVYRSMDPTSHGLHYRERLVKFDGTEQNERGRQVRLYTPLMKAGYIHRTQDGNWQIQPAREIGGTTYARIGHRDLGRLERDLSPVPGCRNASWVYFQPDAFDYKDVRGGFLRIKKARVLRASATERKGLLKGTVIRSGPMPTKRSEAVIYPVDDTAKSIPVSDEMAEIYRAQISQEQEQLLGLDGVLNDGQPVFYLKEKGELTFFGHTMMMRLPYPDEHTPKDFIPEELRDATHTDLAEAIFGYVGEKKLQERQQAWAGRVFVHDAHLQTGQSDWQLQEEPITPKTLGSPKPTTFQHYLVQRNPDPFQAGRTRDGRPRYRKELSDYTAQPGVDSVIRGHKLYWHRGNVSAAQIDEDQEKIKPPEEDTQHTQIRPVRSGVSFAFSIRFENLSQVELGALLWVLTLPGEDGKEYRHKLGMGKPLGMGSVHLQPELGISDRIQRYRSLFGDNGNWHQPQSDQPDVSDLIAAFESFVLERMDPTERGDAARLQDLSRVQMLLALLEWREATPAWLDQTRYMEIERPDPTRRRTKINEYRDRPVLPLPLDIAPTGNLDDDRTLANRATEEAQLTRTAPDEPVSTLSDTARSSLVEEIRASLTGAEQSPEPDSESEVIIANVSSKEQLEPGMALEVQVTGVDQNRVIVDIFGEDATLQKGNIVPVARDVVDMQERFPIGKQITVFVHRINRRGRVQVTMKRPRGL